MNRAWLLLLCACGIDDAQVTTGEELDVEQQDLSVRTPSDRIAVWQQNIEAMKAAKVRPMLLTNAMVTHAYKPDLVILQEAWQRVLCGNYLGAEATDIEVQNWKQSLKDADGLAYTCREGRGALPGSVLYRLGTTLWGGAQNAGHRRPFSDTLGSQSRTSTPVIWDKTRFVYEDGFEYDDADVPGCSTVVADYKRTAVLLRDTRRTADPGDDKLLAVASVHYATACQVSANRWIAEEMVRRWGTFGGHTLALRIIGGDFNARVDETSDAYVARRREAAQVAWYRGYTANKDWRGGRFIDAAKAKHVGSAICSEWTYPAVSACAASTDCAATCPGWGISGQLMRIDFTFVSNGNGTLAAAKILRSETDDTGAAYADHKATLSVIAY